jgi:hypothetical protein
MKFNQGYCGFKHGFFNAFGIHWVGSKTFAFFFKVPKTVAERYKPKGIKMDKYSDQWKQAEYKIDPSKTKKNLFLNCLRKRLNP